MWEDPRGHLFLTLRKQIFSPPTTRWFVGTYKCFWFHYLQRTYGVISLLMDFINADIL